MKGVLKYLTCKLKNSKNAYTYLHLQTLNFLVPFIKIVTLLALSQYYEVFILKYLNVIVQYSKNISNFITFVMLHLKKKKKSNILNLHEF